jgi:hypothetical protein
MILIQRELDRGLALVDVAPSSNSPLHTKAQKAHDTAAAMLPKISGLSLGDRARIEAKLRELRSRLDRVPAYANLRSYPASFAS